VFGRLNRDNLRIDSESYRELKTHWRLKFDRVRQRFVLTPAEKRVVLFVVAAFMLGLGTKWYRDARPSPYPPQWNKTQRSNDPHSPIPASRQSIFETATPAFTPERKRQRAATPP
jgi:hypothetical protein